MNTKKVIIISAATCLSLQFIIWVLGWMIWPIGILSTWIFLGHVARKMSSHTHMKNNRGWNYVMCNLCPLIPIMIMLVADKDIFLGKFNFPKFRSPFIWSEKELDKQENKD